MDMNNTETPATTIKNRRPVKGHKVQPMSSKGFRVHRRSNAVVSGEFMAWECALCHEPAHVGDSARWRHGEMPGGERYETSAS